MSALRTRSLSLHPRARTVAASLVAQGALLLAGCVGSGDVAGPVSGGGGAAVRASIAARLQVDAPAGALLRLTPAYLRLDGTSRDLPAVTAPLGTAAEEQVAVEIEFGACLADPERAGWQGATPTAGECVLTLRFALLVENAQVDTATIGPLAIRGGQRVIPGAVSLQEAAALQLFTADGTPLSTGSTLTVVQGTQLPLAVRMIDGAGRSRPSPPVAWEVTPPNLASVSSAGVLTALTPGDGAVGVQGGGVSVAYPLRVLRPPAELRIEAAAGSSGRVTITSTPAGIQCTLADGVPSGTCRVEFPGDSTVALHPRVEGNTEFRGFAGDCTGDGDCRLPMTVARVVRVSSVERFPLTVSPTGDGTGTVISEPAGVRCLVRAGTASADGCSSLFPIGTEVTLRVDPDAASDFTGWSGACAGTAPCRLPITAARSVSVGLEARQLLTVTGTGTGTGTVTSTPAGISCPITAGVAGAATCAAAFPKGSTVTLTTTPAAGFDFDGWEGPCAGGGGTGACTLAMTAGITVAARLTTRQQLTVGATGGGTGTITSAPAGINCTITEGTPSGSCTAAFPEGTVVTLTATAGALTDFVGWSGACAGAGGCTVTMSGARTALAALALRPLLTITGTGTGSGTVTSAPAGISCTITAGTASGSCAARFPLGASVALTLTPASGSDFRGWGGACTGEGACTVVLTANRTVAATLAARQPLAVGATGGGTGTITSAPAGINCTITEGTPSGSCTAAFPEGTVVTLTATAGALTDFVGWSGACAGTGSCTVTLTEPRDVTATLALYPLLTVAMAGNGEGVVTSTPEPIGCQLSQEGGYQGSQSGPFTTGTCTARFPRGTVVTLTQEAGEGSTFGGWEGACAGAATCTVTLTDDRTVTASFGRNAGTFRLTVEANIANTGSGTVISGQQEISCTITQQTSGTCSADFPRGTQVTLTPLAGAQSSFGGWGGACSGFQGCTVTLNEDLTVSARFFRAIGIRLPGGTPTAPPAPQKSPVTTRTPRPPAR